MPTSIAPRRSSSCLSQAGEPGFTLIEVMIVVAIVAILATIAMPSYRDYILRGQLINGPNLLSAARANMERYYQDNRTYAKVSSTIAPPCDASVYSDQQRTLDKFVLTCTAPSAPDNAGYTLTAQGTGPVAAFSYTVTQMDVRNTTIAPGGPWPAGSSACYVMKKGQAC